MTVNEISLFVLVGLIALLVWYVDTHSTDKPRRKHGHRQAKPTRKAPAQLTWQQGFRTHRLGFCVHRDSLYLPAG